MAHVIMETDKSQDLQGELPSWRPSWSSTSLKAGKLKTQEGLVFQFKSEGRKRLVSQCKSSQTGRILSSSEERQPFCFFRPSTDWTRLTHPGEYNLLYSVY